MTRKITPSTFDSLPHELRAPICREFIPVVDPTEFRTRVENAIDNLIALLDAIDAPREVLEGHNPDDEDCEGDEQSATRMRHSANYRRLCGAAGNREEP